jgi:hypothetical protein
MRPFARLVSGVFRRILNSKLQIASRRSGQEDGGMIDLRALFPIDTSSLVGLLPTLIGRVTDVTAN